jgi:hypothetical protein
MSASAYLDAIAAAYAPPPAGSQTIQANRAYSYSDVRALIAQARDAAVAKLQGPTYDVGYVSHVMGAIGAARDAVTRALGKASAAYSGDIRAGINAARDGVAASYGVLGVYDRAIANAVLLRQTVVALPTFATIASDVAGPVVDSRTAIRLGVPVAHDFAGTITWYLDDIADTLSGLQSLQDQLETLNTFNPIADAFQFLFDVLRGAWSVVGALGSVVRGLGWLAPIAIYGGVAYVGYWGAKRVGLIGAKSA